MPFDAAAGLLPVPATTTGDGQQVWLQPAPIVGLDQVNAVSTSAQTTEAGTHYVVEWRYAEEGVHFTAWQPLPVVLPPARLDAPYGRWLEFRLTQQGPGSLRLVALDLQATYCAPLPLPPHLRHLPFADLVNTPDHLALQAALLAQLARPGTLAAAVDATDAEGRLWPEQVAFWGATCSLLALALLHARRQPQFDQDPGLLAEYLRQQGLLLPPRLDLPTLRTLLRQLPARWRARGTAAVAELPPAPRWPSSMAVSSQRPPGELAQALNLGPGAPLRLTPAPIAAVGWWLGHAGPGRRDTRALPGLAYRYGPTLGAWPIYRYDTPAPLNEAAACWQLAEDVLESRVGLLDGATPRGLVLGPTPHGPAPWPISPGADYELEVWLQATLPAAVRYDVAIALYDGQLTPLATLSLATNLEVPRADYAYPWRTVLGAADWPPRTRYVHPILTAQPAPEAPSEALAAVRLRLPSPVLRPAVLGPHAYRTAPPTRPYQPRQRRGPRGLATLNARPPLVLLAPNRHPARDEAAQEMLIGRLLVPATQPLLPLWLPEQAAPPLPAPARTAGPRPFFPPLPDPLPPPPPSDA